MPRLFRPMGRQLACLFCVAAAGRCGPGISRWEHLPGVPHAIKARHVCLLIGRERQTETVLQTLEATLELFLFLCLHVLPRNPPCICISIHAYAHITDWLTATPHSIVTCSAALSSKYIIGSFLSCVASQLLSWPDITLPSSTECSSNKILTLKCNIEEFITAKCKHSQLLCFTSDANVIKREPQQETFNKVQFVFPACSTINPL